MVLDVLDAKDDVDPGLAEDVGELVGPDAHDLGNMQGRTARLLVDRGAELNVYCRKRPSEPDALVGSAQALRDACGWTPQIPWETTLSDILADWRKRVAAGA